MDFRCLCCTHVNINRKQQTEKRKNDQKGELEGRAVYLIT